MSATKKNKKTKSTKKEVTKRRATDRPKPAKALIEASSKAEEYFQHLDNLARERRARVEAFIEAHRDLPCIDRSEEWLKFVLLEEPIEFGDQEAAVYLTSRREDCADAIQRINRRWLHQEQRMIDECCGDSVIPTIKLDGRKSRVVRRKHAKGMSAAEARKIEQRSEFELRDFWWGYNQQGQTIDATMLRTVEWCGIGGFEPWWKRLSRRTTRDFVDGGLDPGPLVYWLFAMSRSQLAIKMFPKALKMALENLELVRTGSHPWTQWNPNARRPGRPKEYIYAEFEDIAYASTLLFANYRLKGSNERDGELLDSAVGVLQKYQRNDGSWAYFSHDAASSIEATAMTIHALAFHKPVGWERNVARAATMLKGSQKEGGYWDEDSCPDATYLTVLVLDALELSNGGNRVTFTGVPDRSNPQLRKGREFRVALSFPGEARERVELVAERLVSKLGKGKVFYDNYFKHRLARPNLDILLQSVYQKDSDLVVVWASSDYARKKWCCNVEWPAIRVAIQERPEEDIMFLSLDEGKPKGFLSNFGYVDVKDMSADEVSGLILKRLEDDFLPRP